MQGVDVDGGVSSSSKKHKTLSLDARPHHSTSGKLGAPAERQSREPGGPLELPQASPKRWESPLHTLELGIQRAPRAHSPSIPRTFAYYSLHSWSRRQYTRSQSRDVSRTTRHLCHTLRCCTHAVTSALAQGRRKEVVEHCCDCYIKAGRLRRRAPRHPWMGLPIVAAIDPRPQSRYKAGQCDLAENAQRKQGREEDKLGARPIARCFTQPSPSSAVVGLFLEGHFALKEIDYAPEARQATII